METVHPLLSGLQWSSGSWCWPRYCGHRGEGQPGWGEPQMVRLPWWGRLPAGEAMYSSLPQTSHEFPTWCKLGWCCEWCDIVISVISTSVRLKSITEVTVSLYNSPLHCEGCAQGHRHHQQAVHCSLLTFKSTFSRQEKQSYIANIMLERADLLKKYLIN